MRMKRVAAAVICDGRKIFAAQRGHGEYKGFWEFPGGKIEEGETPEQAAVRETLEELGVDIILRRLICVVEYDYPDFHLQMHCFMAEIISGYPQLREHDDARWLSKEELRSVRWLPADGGVIDKLEKILN